MDSLDNFNSTKKRNIEINVYKFKKMERELSMLKLAALILLICFIPLILGKLKIISGKIGVAIYGIIILLAIIYIIYFLFFMDIGRDEQKWDEINFRKPEN